ncbi:MAG TPA: SsgA family sporulation/cell division regulator [Actinospica sp.]|nr:SsgA family sporulation/cell division regulator [Actinospica sp.]
MSSPVTRKLTAQLLIDLDACLDFPVTAGYDVHDPYAVRFAFPPLHRPGAPGPNTDDEDDADDDVATTLSWTFGRELLADGLHKPTGEGDVQVWPCGPDLVMVEFRAEAGSMLLAVPARELRTFLFLSYAEVPPGYETRYLELDRLLHDLMGKA